MKIELELAYRLSAGRLKPWADALAKGEALGRVCSTCGAVSFPPLRRCRCGAIDAEWKPLTGKADILRRTEGLDGAYALVQFDGADNRTVAALHDAGAIGDRGMIAAPATGTLVLAVGPANRDDA